MDSSCRILLLACVLCWFSGAADAAQNPTFRDLALPLYVDHLRSPVAVIRVRTSVRDHLQREFFKFGVLPILKVDRLSIDVYHPAEGKQVLNRTTATLFKMQAASSARSESPVSRRKRGICGVDVSQFELKRLEAGRVLIHLTADRASKFGQGHWKLRGGKLVLPDRKESFPSATLQITDDDFVLHLPTLGQVPLFAPTTSNSAESRSTERKTE